MNNWEQEKKWSSNIARHCTVCSFSAEIIFNMRFYNLLCIPTSTVYCNYINCFDNAIPFGLPFNQDKQTILLNISNLARYVIFTLTVLSGTALRQSAAVRDSAESICCYPGQRWVNLLLSKTALSQSAAVRDSVESICCCPGQRWVNLLLSRTALSQAERWPRHKKYI